MDTAWEKGQLRWELGTAAPQDGTSELSAWAAKLLPLPWPQSGRDRWRNLSHQIEGAEWMERWPPKDVCAS